MKMQRSRASCGLVLAVAQLAGDAEDVGGEALVGLDVAGRGRAVEQIHSSRAVLDALAQHVHDAALGDLTLQAVQELQSLRTIHSDTERLYGVWLGGVQEGEQLG